MALSAETKFHIQKYDGLENIENPSPALEVTLGSSTDTNLGILETAEKPFFWPLIFFNIFFDISAPWATQNRSQN